jgi:hypothetical protein
VVFSDAMDALRRIHENVPDPECLLAHLGKPRRLPAGKNRDRLSDRLPLQELRSEFRHAPPLGTPSPMAAVEMPRRFTRAVKGGAERPAGPMGTGGL